jgi:hypothetical protein
LSLILSEEHRQGVLDNAVVVNIFGHTKHEVTADRKRMHKVRGFIDFYSSPNFIRVINQKE